MKKQDVKKRINNFKEVALGFSEEEALKEASRCLFCKNPKCSADCPVEIDIPRFIDAIKKSDYGSAISIIKERNNLPGVCGRVCPQENQCEGACVLGIKGKPINIGALERFAADFGVSSKGAGEKEIKRNKKKVAVIGSGPAGLTCAGDLARMGCEVTVYEALHEAGGVLVYGIPEFRLPKNIVRGEVEYLKSLGVKVETNFVVGPNYSLEEIFKDGYEAVFIGTGAGLPSFMKIPGENLNRVYSSNELLTRANLMKAYLFPDYDTPINIGKKVAVVGGGNTAMDSARVCLRLGAEKVYVAYRRSEKEMPARIEEVENAKEEGVEFHVLTLPKEILGEEKSFVSGMRCVRMKLGEPDKSGRRRPIEIEGSDFIMDVDTVIVAIGQNPNPVFLKSASGLDIDRWSKITVDQKTQATNIKGVYAGGDASSWENTVIAAMGAGKRAAKAIDRYLNE